MIKKLKFIGLAIVGPTSSGKSELAVTLAKLLDTEILSVDSRQIYKGMDIGSGKVSPLIKTNHSGSSSRKLGSKLPISYLYKNIPHYGINLFSPKKQFSAAEFKNYAKKIIDKITERNKIPILCGGTMHWIDAIIYNQTFPNVPPNPKLRKILEKETTENLILKLSKLDPARANTIDTQNRRRLIRALEIVITSGNPVPTRDKSQTSNYLWIGLNPKPEDLKNKISKRLETRIQEGLLDEIQNLHNKGLSWKKLINFGLEYKHGSLFLQKKIDYENFVSNLTTDILHYAKRQMTWWKRNKEIHWFQTAEEALNFIDRTHPHWHHNKDEISHRD